MSNRNTGGAAVSAGVIHPDSADCGLTFCDRPALADAPVAICGKHARLIYEFGRDLVASTFAQRGIPLEVIRLFADPVVERWNTASDLSDHYSSGVVVNRKGIQGVYYVRVGERIKIGRSVDVHQRIKGYPPGRELLAVEVSGSPEALERKRLAQFRHCRVDGWEWFSPHPDLMAHIASLQAAM